MLNVVTWLLAVELLGLLAFPILFYLTRWLPDRGFTLAKPAGMLLVFYLLWLLASITPIPNSIFTIWFILLAVGAACAWLVRKRRQEMRDFLRREWRVFLVSEVVFLGVFAIWTWTRTHDAAINHTEQPMDFAFLNASAIASHFPPQDPWLAGEPVSYYYFGYLIFGGVTRLAGVGTAVGYNLALATVAGLAALGAYGLVVNIVRLVGGRLRWAMASGLVAVVLLTGIANLVSGLEFARASGAGSPDFWKQVDIRGLDGPSKSTHWYPSDPGWWWWRATRVINTAKDGGDVDYTITEFPFFSFLLGDLHPHVMSLPFVLAFIGLALSFFLTPGRLGVGMLRRNAWALAALALTLGALGFISLWDLPTFGALLATALLARAYGQERSVVRAVLVALVMLIPVLLLTWMLYLPFYLGFDSQAKGVLPVGEYVTRPLHFMVIWGLFLAIALPLVAWEVVAALRRGPKRLEPAVIAATVALLPWLAWVLVEGVAVWDPAKMAGLAWRRLLHLMPLMLVLDAAVYAALRRMRDPAPAAVLSPVVAAPEGEMEGQPTVAPEPEPIWAPSKMAAAFALLLVALAFLLLMIPEVFRLWDMFNNRMNTIFKLYYQAWALLAVGCGYAVYYLASRYWRSSFVVRVAGHAWAGLLVVGLIASLYYPVAATYTKTGGLKGKATLDGMEYMASGSLGELAAIRWLKESYRPGERIVEAEGGGYYQPMEYGRVSASTGIPTVLGWFGHEEQWGRPSKDLEERREAVQRLYQTQDEEEARRILRRYDVTYIIIGARELSTYGAGGLAKFASLADVAFQEGDMVVYRVRE